MTAAELLLARVLYLGGADEAGAEPKSDSQFL
jgi:hypothetical protein